MAATNEELLLAYLSCPDAIKHMEKTQWQPNYQPVNSSL
ncbi:hypothetical protein ADIARSV_2269 [Arcticibacter svalbardensis MN12-7]|uniref:Uncharacterized protein n=1 Tax=Arcticibacter svalbardensis MN12-7 TaxID=1150600 RepID=R9GSK1_9SPHI|nr:hypothetical protein ADIARSV_2269 [Arcticibacter svalbardensis MN12-7]